MRILRQYIRMILEATSKDKPKEEYPVEDLLLEPDLIEDPKKADEFSVAGGIAGVSTPLGTGPTYPAPRKNKKSKSKK